jgi:LPS export ABC transporter protein LptC
MSLDQNSRGVASPLRGLGAAPRARLRRFALLAVSVGVSVWLWQWVSTDDQGVPLTQKSDEPSLEVDDLQSFLVRRDGLPLWQISAKHVSMAADKQSTEATGVGKGTLYREGKPFLHMSARKLKLTNTSNDLEATGGVQATGPDEFSFGTGRAVWRNQSQTVFCPQPVTAKLKNVIFETKRLFYNWDKGILTCPEPVEVRAPGAVLRGKNLEATLKTRQIKLSGGVEMVFAPRNLKNPLAR